MIQARIHRRTGGWPAGMVLLLQRLRPEARPSPRSADVASEAVFDYFAHEILSDESAEVQQFLTENRLNLPLQIDQL